MKITNFKTLSLMLLSTAVLALTGCDKSGTPSDAEGIIGVDRTVPVVTLAGDARVILNEGDTYTDAGATAVDDIDDQVSVVITGKVDTTTPGVYTLTYTVTDSRANASSVTRTVTVLDITAPVITLVGGDVTLNEGDTYTEAGATAADNVDGSLPVVIRGTVDAATPGVYTLTYTATDSSANASSVARTVTVLDITAPVITLVGGDVTLNEGDTYTEAGATAADNVDGSVPVVITGTVDAATPGVYTLTYTATDSSANASSVARTVTVLDITPPVITLVGGDVTLNEGDTYTEAGATAADNVDGSLPVVITGTVDTATPGVYTLTYTATDSSSNEASVTRTVNVESSGPAPLDGNITIDNASLQRIIASIFDNTPYDPTISIQGVINAQGLSVSVPYTVNNAQVTLPAYSTSVPLDATVTEDDEAGIVATFAWKEQVLSVGSGTFTATITIDDSAASYPDNIYNAKRLDIEDDIAGLVAATFPYPTDSVGGTGMLTLKILPGIPDRMFGIADNTGDDTTHMFIYLPVTNATTGKTWLNNNLGANYANANSPAFDPVQQATASNDHNAYGSLFQWGRKADGHELMTWTDGATGTGTNGTTSTLSDDPADALFITNATTSPYDWRVTQDDTLWAAESSANNVCPVGYRVPTSDVGGELDSERLSWGTSDAAGAFSSTLVLPKANYREYYNGEVILSSFGVYWGSTASSGNSNYYLFHDASWETSSIMRGYGFSVRCIKD